MVASRVQARIVRYVLPALTKSASKGPESSSPAAQPLQVVAAVSAAVFRRLWNGTRTRSSSAAFQLYTCFLNDLSLRVAVCICWHDHSMQSHVQHVQTLRYRFQKAFGMCIARGDRIHSCAKRASINASSGDNPLANHKQNPPGLNPCHTRE